MGSIAGNNHSSLPDRTRSPARKGRGKKSSLRYVGFALALLLCLCSLLLSANFSMDYAYSNPSDNWRRVMDVPTSNLRKDSAGLVYLMSFPNSGTTYTIENLQQVTNTTAATMYGTEMNAPHAYRSTDGPFLYLPQLRVPSLLLTKTHCDGYNDYAGHDLSILNVDQFELGCRTGTRSVGNIVIKPVHTARPVKAIHLLRNPLSNLVARMHRGLNKRRKFWKWPESELSKFNDTKAGFAAWCDSIDTKFFAKGFTAQEYGLPNKIDDLIHKVPCFSDLIRYVRWHNHALEVSTRLRIPVHFVYYEDYASSLERTVKDLVDFLDLSIVKEPLDFYSGNNYDHLFEPSEARAAAELVHLMASPKSWTYLRQYAADWLNPKTTRIATMDNERPHAPLVQGSEDGYAQIVWLMSFPNSGTSYTMNNVRRTSNMTTATNYAAEALHTANMLIPVRPELQDGPFVLSPRLKVPKYILAKTHCTAYCDACHTMDTIRALDLFEEGCRITTKGVWPNLTKMSQRYQPKKAVHIFRSPFDNLIARKHLGAKRRISLGIFNKNHTAFRDDRAGMLAWCDFIDQGFGTSVHNKGIKPFTDETTRLMKKVPCYSDWFRYIQWHDLALAATDQYAIPMHYMFYEEYSFNYEKTVHELNDFLELPTVDQPEPFVAGKTYRELFLRKDVNNAIALVKHLATIKLWKKIQHYFEAEQFEFDRQETKGTEDETDDEYTQEEDRDSVDDDKRDRTEEYADAAQEKNVEQVVDAATDDFVDKSADRNVTKQREDESSEVVLKSSLTKNALPEVAWLLSFPNSGTSYTITNIMWMTNRTQATSHGMEVNESIPLRPDLPHGPFILDPTKKLPKYALTKSHCTGFCDVCNQTQSKKKLRSFEMGCTTTKELINGKFERFKYESSFAKKVVHVVRSPWDNLVARMHLGVKDRVKAGFPTSLLNTFNDTIPGVLSWCRYMDEEFAKAANASFFSQEANALMSKVPCHSDLFRYIQWHNLAIELTEKLRLPSTVVHYEDYATKHKQTIDKLLAFLEADPVQPPLEFVLGKTYGHLYTPEHARAMALLARSMASAKCWELLRRYFEHFVDASELAKIAATTE